MKKKIDKASYRHRSASAGVPGKAAVAGVLSSVIASATKQGKYLRQSLELKIILLNQ